MCGTEALKAWLKEDSLPLTIIEADFVSCLDGSGDPVGPQTEVKHNILHIRQAVWQSLRTLTHTGSIAQPQ